MNSVMQRHFRTAAALGAFALAFAGAPAHAVGTQAGTPVNNTATVQFSIGNVQQSVQSNQTSFVVDRVVNFTVSTSDATFVDVTPGQTTAFVTFLLSHAGNGSQGFRLTATNAAAGTSVFGSPDNADVTSLAVYVAPNDSAVFVPSAPTSNGYVLGNLDSVAPAATAVTRRVVVLVSAPTTLTAAQIAGVQLQAQGAVAGTNGATLETASANADVQDQVDVVIATAGNAASSLSALRVSAPTVAVAKSSIVVSDPVNNTSNPKAIPGAIVEYRIQASNTGNAAAQQVGFTDALPAATTFEPAGYGASANVQIVQAGNTTTCFAEAGADANADGCFLQGGTLTVVRSAPNAVTLSSSGPNSSVEFRFRVKVNP
jgi:uncharacterized repeat protein (TIGR01451 family)